MTCFFLNSIQTALAAAAPSHQLGAADVPVIGAGTLPSCFATSGLAIAAVQAAAAELSALTDQKTTVNRRHALMWFNFTLMPQGWVLPDPWDPIAGDYAAADGFIRLHTNAPHHAAAALHVLASEADRDAVARAVKTWRKADLERAVIGAGGAAAAMMSQDDWAAHPQGKSVAAEPLIHWCLQDTDAPPAQLNGLKILDLTRVLAGPVATRFLAGFGAEVLRIDPPHWNEPSVVPEVTLGKSCTGLDLKRPEDRSTFEALLAQADVLVHGYRPSAMIGLGYTDAVLRTIAPHLINVSLCAYGHTAPGPGGAGSTALYK